MFEQHNAIRAFARMAIQLTGDVPLSFKIVSSFFWHALIVWDIVKCVERLKNRHQSKVRQCE